MDLIYLTIKNYGWAGLPAYRTSLGRALLDPAPEPPADQGPLTEETKEYNGWRLSWSEPKRARAMKRRLCLEQHFLNRPPAAGQLPMAMAHRSLAQKEESERLAKLRRQAASRRRRAWCQQAGTV